MRHFPLFFAMEEARVVIVGGGEGAAQKFRLISRSVAAIDLLTPTLVPELRAAVAGGTARHVPDAPSVAAFEDAKLVIVVTGCAALDAAAAGLARAAGAVVNVVDRPALSDVIMPAIVDRDPVVVAIGTEGTAPVLARQIKTRLETMLEPGLGRFAAHLGTLRGRVAHRVAPKARRAFWEWMVAGPRRRFAQGAEDAARAEIEAALTVGRAPDDVTAPVAIVAEDARDLLTLRAVERLRSADLILYGPGLGPEVLELARRDAERTMLAPADGPAAWHLARGARQAVEAQSDGQRVVWLTDQPGEAAAALARLGQRPEQVPGAARPSGVVARAEDG